MWTCPVCVSCSWLSSLCRPTWNCISDSCTTNKFIIILFHRNEDQFFSSVPKFISKYFYLDTAFLEYHKYSSPSFDQLLLLFFIFILVFLSSNLFVIAIISRKLLSFIWMRLSWKKDTENSSEWCMIDTEKRNKIW